MTATASDNVAVASVQFQLDGANVGALDTTAPYAFSWNTTTATNGSHTLRAIAKDTSNNSTTSAAVTVTVNNVARYHATVGAYRFDGYGCFFFANQSDLERFDR